MKKWDKIYLIVSAPVSFCMFIISVLDGGRFGWEPRIPIAIVVIGIVVSPISATNLSLKSPEVSTVLTYIDL